MMMNDQSPTLDLNSIVVKKTVFASKDKSDLQKISAQFRQNYDDIFNKKNAYCVEHNVETKYSDALDVFIYRALTSKIVNGVAPITLAQPIDLKRVIQTCKDHGLRYKVHRKFSGVPVVIEEDGLKFTAVFFASGKINLIGLKEDSLEYLNSIVSVLRKYEHSFFNKPLLTDCTKRFANRVYSLKIPQVIDLSDLNKFNDISTWRNIKYNSEAFPGVVIRFDDLQAKALFFKTGSVILTGVGSIECKKKVLLHLVQVLVQYLKI